MKGIIYIHRNKTNGKCYVGQTIRSPHTRWGENGRNYIEKNKDGKFIHPKFARAILKHGFEDGFEHIVLPTVYKTQEELDAAEIATIAKYDSFNNGYNATLGGGGGAGKHNTVSEETKRKISEFHKGKVVSEETRKKMSEAQKGRVTSEETKRKLSDAAKKHFKTECGTFKGKKHSEESKLKMSEAKKGRPSPRKGRVTSEETKRKISEAKRKSYKGD